MSDFDRELPTNPKFGDRVEWNDSILQFRTVACFADGGSLWLMQDVVAAQKIFISAPDAKRLAEEILKRIN